MFKITIEGGSLDELWGNLSALAMQMAGEEPAPVAKPTKPAKKVEEYKPDAADVEEPDPMPETAKAVVDAGTGQPVVAEEPTKQMTVDDVRSAAAKLAAADSPKLAAILKAHGAVKLSEVPNDKLGDFASDVMEALG